MWISSKAFDWFRVSQGSFEMLREEISGIKAERDTLRSELASLRVTNDWLRMKVNGLELERAALLEKAYDIKIPAPQIARQPIVDPTHDPKNFSFSDLGDTLATKIGFPAHDH